MAASLVEQEVGAYLRVLSLPDDAKERILTAYHAAKPAAAARVAECRALEAQRRRLADLYQLGEIERGEYESRLSALRMEIALLTDADAHGRTRAAPALRTRRWGRLGCRRCMPAQSPRAGAV